MKRLSQPSSTTPGKRAEKLAEAKADVKRVYNAKSRKSLFHFKTEKVKKFECCVNLWKQNIFITQCGN